MPTVSVVIPTYNRPDLIPRAVRSVLAQTFQDFEIVVVDDGTEQRAEEAVKALGDSRVRYIAHEKSLGAPVARNRGVREARASLVAFLDDDDEWLPQKIEQQVATLTSLGKEVGFCFSSVINVDDDKEERTVVAEGVSDFSLTALRKFNGFMTSTLLVHRDAFLAVGGFDEVFPSHQEAELMIRLSERYQGVGIAEPLVRMSASPARPHIGGSITRRLKGREMLFAKHAERYAKHPEILARHKFWIGFMYRDAGMREEARRSFQEAWRLDGRLEYLIRLIAFWVLGR